jgi:cell division protein FtsL
LVFAIDIVGKKTAGVKTKQNVMKLEKGIKTGGRKKH